MSRERMMECLEWFVFDHEGRVNEDVPGDPGGKTHWGITQEDYDIYRHERGLPLADVFHMSQKEVNDLYYKHYWLPLHCDELPQKLDLVVFDTGVNLGCSRAMRMLQSLIGVYVDGYWGPQTKGAVIAIRDPNRTANAYVDIRIAFYYQLVNLKPMRRKFLRGWINRCNDLKRHIPEPASHA